MRTYMIRFTRYAQLEGRKFSGEYSILADDFAEAASIASLMATCFNDAAPKFKHAIHSLSAFDQTPMGSNTFEDGWQMLTDLVSDDAE
jgi:hypothetical protein